MKNLPNDIIWDLTYACPLRCGYCYSESGRRENKEQDTKKLMDIADKIIELHPDRVAFSGGEPLLVKSVYSLASYLKSKGIRVTLYTSGYTINSKNVSKILECFPEVRVSLDCHIPEINDRVRGKKGGAQRALQALELLLSNRRHNSDNVVGIDTVVVQDNLPHLNVFCHHIARHFPTLDFINMGVAIPSGLANRQTFADTQLLTFEQLESVRDPRFIEHLRAPFPKEQAQHITISDNFRLLMSAQDIESGTARVNAIQIEPDGKIRGSLIYEGTVGHILHDEISTILYRIQERLSDPLYVKVLKEINTLQQWAESARTIDLHYTTGKEHQRIAKRHSAHFDKNTIHIMTEETC